MSKTKHAACLHGHAQMVVVSAGLRQPPPKTTQPGEWSSPPVYLAWGLPSTEAMDGYELSQKCHRQTWEHRVSFTKFIRKGSLLALDKPAQ